MAIVFVLTGTVGVVGGRQIDRARYIAAEHQVEALTVALEMYRLDCGGYPSSEQGLAALVKAPVLAPVPQGWAGPYLAGPVPLDPWRRPFTYAAPEADRFSLSYQAPEGDRP
jgi:general secretion pathway protein G